MKADKTSLELEEPRGLSLLLVLGLEVGGVHVLEDDGLPRHGDDADHLVDLEGDGVRRLDREGDDGAGDRLRARPGGGDNCNPQARVAARIGITRN